MNPAQLSELCGVIAFGCFVLFVVAILRWCADRSADRAAGVQIGQASHHEGPGLPWPMGSCGCDTCMAARGLEPWPDPPPEPAAGGDRPPSGARPVPGRSSSEPAVAHFISVCSCCHQITSLNATFTLLRSGDTLRVSHGYFKACNAAYLADLERLLPVATSQPSTPQLSTAP